MSLVNFQQAIHEGLDTNDISITIPHKEKKAREFYNFLELFANPKRPFGRIRNFRQNYNQLFHIFIPQSQ